MGKRKLTKEEFRMTVRNRLVTEHGFSGEEAEELTEKYRTEMEEASASPTESEVIRTAKLLSLLW